MSNRHLSRSVHPRAQEIWPTRSTLDVGRIRARRSSTLARWLINDSAAGRRMLGFRRSPSCLKALDPLFVMPTSDEAQKQTFPIGGPKHGLTITS